MNDKLLEQIGDLLTSHTELLRKEIKDSEDRITSKLEVKIAKAQEDTIEVLTDLMSNSYDNHEEKIQKNRKAVTHFL